MNEISVLIADDDPTVRDTLKYVIGREPWLRLTGEAADAEEAVQIARDRHPDVALVDVKMPGGGGVRAARDIKACSPDTKIVALSAYDDEATLCAMVVEGIEGYLVKGSSIADILEALKGAVGGETPLSPSAARGVVHELAERLEIERIEAESFEKRAGRIRHLMQGDEISTAYKPIVELQTERPVGLEALARFRSIPTVRPDVIFAEAAKVGLAEELEVAALEDALESLDRIPDDQFLAINVSPATLGSGRFLESLSEATPHRIVLEITEKALVRDYPALREEVQQLRGLGVRIAIDETGAGYSTFRHVLELGPEFIKLDVALVRDVDADPAQRALAASLAAFAHETNASIEADGIDRPSQLEILRNLGFAYGQGDLFGRPMPLRQSTNSTSAG